MQKKDSKISSYKEARRSSKKVKEKTKNSTFVVKLIAVIGIVFSLSVFLIAQFFVFNQEHEMHNSSSQEFENTIPLLAVFEENGTVKSASTIPLHLEIRKGSGNIYVNLNSYAEIDTQISITNSNHVVCELLELPCEYYDFYYSFEDASLILRGPSASTSIAVLTYATIHQISLEDSFALTGNLNSNGIIGMVGGIKEKVSIASQFGFEKVFIPYNGLTNSEIESFAQNQSVEVVEVLDIINLLQQSFNNPDISIKRESFSNERYLETMQFLANNLCNISQDYLLEVEEYNITNNRVNISLNQINNSKQAKEDQEFYSQGSFCYSANLGLKTVINRDKIESAEQLQNLVDNQRENITQKISEFDSFKYSLKVSNLNDLYVFLLVKNRLYEALNYVNISQELLDSSLNYTASINVSSNISLNETLELSKQDFNTAIAQFSLSQERLGTVELWETLFDSNSPKKTRLSIPKAQETCQLYVSQLRVTDELLKQYNIDFVTERIDEVEELFTKDPFRCIYSALELKGRVNAIVSGITISNETDYIDALNILQDVALERMEFHSQGELPLIPYIYYEYSKSLEQAGDLQSASQYIHASLAFSELNILLDETPTSDKEFETFKFKVLQEKEEKLQQINLISYIFLILTGGFIVFNFLN